MSISQRFRGFNKIYTSKGFWNFKLISFQNIIKIFCCTVYFKIAGKKSLPYSKHEMMNLYWVNWPNLTYILYLFINFAPWLAIFQDFSKSTTFQKLLFFRSTQIVLCLRFIYKNQDFSECQCNMFVYCSSKHF